MGEHEPLTLGECETVILSTGARLVMRPATPGEDETNVQRRGVASLHHDAVDLWWRGLWNGQWHFADTEADLREMLAEDLETGRVALNPRATAGEV